MIYTAALMIGVFVGALVVFVRGYLDCMDKIQGKPHVPPRPIPHSVTAIESAWLSFPHSVRLAYGSFERYKNHLDADPSRGLDNPVPQPMSMHMEPTKQWPKW